MAWLGATLVFAGLAIVAFVCTEASQSGVDQARAEVDEIALLQSRVAISRATQDELLVRLAEPLGYTSSADVDRATDTRIETLVAEGVVLDELTTASEPARSDAAALIDELARTGPGTDPDAPVGRVIAAVDSATGSTSERTDLLAASSEVAWLDLAVGWVLGEALVGAYALEQPADPPADVTNLPLTLMLILQAGDSWLGDDPAAPLHNSRVPIEAASAEFPATVDAVNEVLVASQAWEFDRWTDSWEGDQIAPAPHDLDSFTQTSFTVLRFTRAMIDDDLDSARTQTETALAQQRQRQDRARTATFVAVVLTLGAATITVTSGSRRSRNLTQLAMADGLTGLGNRNLLETRTRHLLADDDYSYHVIATIDLDHFKAINDTYGHAVGDTVLCQVADALERILLVLMPTAGTAIRLGGDEFLLSLHGNAPIDTDLLRHHLERIRGRRVPAIDDHSVAIEFSFGIVAVEGPCDLADVMASADRATYVEKKQRRPMPPRKRRPTIGPMTARSEEPVSR